MFLVREEIREVTYKRELEITDEIIEDCQEWVDNSFPNSGFKVTAEKLADIFEQNYIDSPIENTIYDWLNEEMWAIDGDIVSDSYINREDWVEE